MRYFIVYLLHLDDGSISVRNGIVRASALLDSMEHIEALEHELSKEAGKDGYARLVHFIPLSQDGGA